MIFYTTTPLELVFNGADERNFQQVEIDGVKLMVEATSDNDGVIVQVLSSNLDDYINPALQPGKRVKLNPSATLY